MFEDNTQIYKLAQMTAGEISLMPKYIEGELEFYGSPAFDKLFEYLCFETGEMPYDVAKARSDTPDNWIIERLQG